MPNSVHYDNKTLPLEEGETVLDGLLRHEYDHPYRCNKGICHTCIMQATSGQPSPESQANLNAAQSQLGYFLPCCCTPTEALTITDVDSAAEKAECKVLDVTPLNQSVLRIRCEPTLNYHAGQFVTVTNHEGVSRSYSLASTPLQDDFIEFQIKCVPDGLFSQWAFETLSAGDTLTVEGPYGHCIYTPESSQKDLLLVGMGTGLAPLYGLLKEALHREHQGKIDLIIGARHATQLYLLDELNALSEQYPNLSVTALAQQAEQPANTQPIPIIEGDLYEQLKRDFPTVKDRQIYMCGAESFVRKVRKHCLTSGAKAKDMLIDSFVATGV